MVVPNQNPKSEPRTGDPWGEEEGLNPPLPSRPRPLVGSQRSVSRSTYFVRPKRRRRLVLETRLSTFTSRSSSVKGTFTSTARPRKRRTYGVVVASTGPRATRRAGAGPVDKPCKVNRIAHGPFVGSGRRPWTLGAGGCGRGSGTSAPRRGWPLIL